MSKRRSSRVTRPLHVWCLAIALLCACAGASGSARSAQDTELLARMIAAEDARPHTAEALAPLLEGLRSNNAEVRRIAVRGLGRLEQDSLVGQIAPLLADTSPAVRVEAAHAIGQAVVRGDPASARNALTTRLSDEQDGGVLGAIAETLGRMRHASAQEVASTAAILTRLAPPEANAEQALGVTRGLFFLSRQQPARRALPAETIERLQELMQRTSPTDSLSRESARRIRTLAVAALTASGSARPADLSQVLLGEHDLVRREAAAGAATLSDTANALMITRQALSDASPIVRYEALRSWGRLQPRGRGCAPVVSALSDSSIHVVLLAIDRLSTGCEPEIPVVAILDSLVQTLPADSAHAEGWHRAAHALVALAIRDQQPAQAQLPRFMASGNSFVRAWVARAALQLRDAQSLRTLARDVHPNVRTAAVEGLAAVTQHESDSIYIAQLEQDDSQLLQAAAAALEGTRAPAALPALMAALDRVTAAKRETSRDARTVLLARIRELGNRTHAPRIEPYLRDFDPLLARDAADVLAAWTGTRPQPQPSPLPSLPVPTPARLDSLARARVNIVMQDGGNIELRLYAWDAPTNAARFARLAQAHYFDGLTLHRVAPNFVIQGGSPGANEYAGDGPFTRDELSIPNWRGTVGLSTRGRDTGDGQIYVNIIHNTRLDHDYTVFAEVVAGMAVVDRVLEGAVIRRITVLF